MHSPFPYDKISEPEHFFGRVEELKILEKTVQYSNNILIHSKRRMGKSSLIHNFFKQNEKDYLCIYVDIFDISTKEDFAYSLLKALSNAGKSTDLKSTIKTLTSLFKRVRVEPTIDPTTLKYSIKPIIATLSFEEMIEDFFYSLDELSKKQQVIIAIDEFQQISTLSDVKLDALLRKYIQNRNNISYIFLGSKRHLLTSLFQYKSPLYEMATHFELQPLSLDEVYTYVQKYINISKETLKIVLNTTQGETKLLQHILHLTYIYKKNTLSEEFIDELLEEIVNSKDASFRIIYDSLSNNQKIALKVVGKCKHHFYNEDILNIFNIKKQTLQSAVNALYKKELIDKNGELYFIPDRTFELWIERL